MKAVRPAICFLVVLGCGSGRDFGAERAATPQEQAVAQAAEQSAATLTAPTIDADAFGAMTGRLFGMAGATDITLSFGPVAFGACATVKVDRIDFHCATVGFSLQGFATRTIAGDTRSWNVDLTMTTSGTWGSSAAEVTLHLSGDITVSNHVIDGSLALDTMAHVEANGHTRDAALHASVSYNQVTFDAAQSCATSGNIVFDLESQSTAKSISRALRFSFTGCHTMTVAASF